MGGSEEEEHEGEGVGAGWESEEDEEGVSSDCSAEARRPGKKCHARQRVL
jgi:hypothetical protein